MLNIGYIVCKCKICLFLLVSIIFQYILLRSQITTTYMRAYNNISEVHTTVVYPFCSGKLKAFFWRIYTCAIKQRIRQTEARMYPFSIDFSVKKNNKKIIKLKKPRKERMKTESRKNPIAINGGLFLSVFLLEWKWEAESKMIVWT